MLSIYQILTIIREYIARGDFVHRLCEGYISTGELS